MSTTTPQETVEMIFPKWPGVAQRVNVGDVEKFRASHGATLVGEETAEQKQERERHEADAAAEAQRQAVADAENKAAAEKAAAKQAAADKAAADKAAGGKAPEGGK